MRLNIIYVVASLVALVLIPVFYWIGKTYLRWRKIKEIADSIKASKFEAILEAIANIGDVEPTAALLVEQPSQSDGRSYSLIIPSFLKSAWAGKSIQFEVVGNLGIRLVESKEGSTLGRVRFRDLPVPRIRLKNGKEQNIWSFQRYLSRSSILGTLLEPIAESDRAEALEYILGPTVRVDGGIQWVQGAEYPRCKECNARMNFILQIAGTWFPKTLNFDIRESEIYVFGCEQHPDQLEKVVQFY